MTKSIPASTSTGLARPPVALHERLNRWGQKFADQPWAAPVVLLLICLVGYGLLATTLGLYWDDWTPLYFVNQKNMPAFWNYFIYDRPFSAWTYLLTIPLLGTKLAAWHIFTLLVRWISVVGVWLTMRGVWPQRRREAFFVSALLAVYPSFFQQSVALAYSQHFLCYALFSFSLAAMVWAIKRPRWFLPLMAFSVLADALQLFTMEYFAGVELIRPILLWIVYRQLGASRQKSLWQSLRMCLPFLIILGTFGIWRFGIYGPMLGNLDENSASIVSQFLAAPLATAISLIQMALQDFAHLLVSVWANTLDPKSIEVNASAYLVSMAVGLVGAVLFFGCAIWLRAPEGEKSSGLQPFIGQSIFLGLLTFALGGIPVWITNRQMIVGAWSDRFSLAPMLGVCLLIVGIIAWLLENPRKAAVVGGVLVGLAIALQIRTANEYRRNWDVQKTFFWQLAWRVPAMKEGTVILSPQMPFNLVGDYSIAAAINLLYDPDASPDQMNYWFLNAPRYSFGGMKTIVEDQPVDYSLRTYHFSGSTSDSLVVWYTSGASCLRVLTPIDAQTPSFTSNASDLALIGDTDAIIANPENPAVPQEDIFGTEPAHTWCYYYEKADLALQTGDYEQVVQLGDQATAQGYHAEVGNELFPFIEAYAYTGRWDQAIESTRQAAAISENMEPILCSLWRQIGDQVDTGEAGTALQAELGCK